MRRARIKPVINTSVRRKAQQDGSSTQEPNPKHDEIKIQETESKQSDENSSVSISETKDGAHEALQSAEIVPEKQSEPQNTFVEIKDKELNVLPVTKTECLQKTSSSESNQTKIVTNRSCFMRPIPRLDGGGRIRRNSIQGSATSGASASESEDESVKSSSMTPNRMSDQTSTSGRQFSNSGVSESPRTFVNAPKRRMDVSESARKLAEARREFLLKHENNTPDKSKLTMYDLIYYNPKTNPMKPKPANQKVVSRKNLNKNAEEKKDEEKDEEEEDGEKNKEELAPEEPAEILVPQLKIGPNGQLVIDEKSLVIDQYKAQDIDPSEILVDEDGNGNGFYKRRAKSKDWNKWETMKFYKALNTYGTDFLLMQSVFPKRSRQELKLKYKKEEKLNGNLVEKALRYQEFDELTLKKDIVNIEESEKKEAESVKLVKESNVSSKKKNKNARCRRVAQEVNCDELNSKDSSGEESSTENNCRITITTKYRKLRKRIRILSDGSDSDEKTDESDSRVIQKKIKPNVQSSNR